MCFGNGASSTQIQPTPIGSHSSPGDALSSAAETLVGMLTQAQQMELQSAFRRFDVNGNGTMCVPRCQPTTHPPVTIEPSSAPCLGSCQGPIVPLFIACTAIIHSLTSRAS